MRHLLRVSGVSSYIYWLQFFLADAILFLIPCTLLLILVPIFKIPSLIPAPAMGSLVLCLLLYCPSGILFSYLCSFMFSKWDTAQQVMPQLFMYVSTAECMVFPLCVCVCVCVCVCACVRACVRTFQVFASFVYFYVRVHVCVRLYVRTNSIWLLISSSRQSIFYVGYI